MNAARGGASRLVDDVNGQCCWYVASRYWTRHTYRDTSRDSWVSRLLIINFRVGRESARAREGVPAWGRKLLQASTTENKTTALYKLPTIKSMALTTLRRAANRSTRHCWRRRIGSTPAQASTKASITIADKYGSRSSTNPHAPKYLGLVGFV